MNQEWDKLEQHHQLQHHCTHLYNSGCYSYVGLKLQEGARFVGKDNTLRPSLDSEMQGEKA